jgi:siroheme synthase-like protein
MTASIFPVGLHLEGRRCLVVGGNDEAAERAERLRAAGACVAVVSPDVGARLEALAGSGDIDLVRRQFAESDLDEAWLVVQTKRDPALASRIGAACEARRVFFCATDDPERHGFSHVAIARAGLVQVAVSTGGHAPALARRLREELERVLSASSLADFAERLARLRETTPSAERARVLGDAVRDVRLTGSLELPDEAGQNPTA